MSSGRLTHFTIRALDWLAARTLPLDKSPAHQQTGRRGEEAAYFYLRKLDYVIVARNFRTHYRRGEIDLIAWRRGTLCFIEVKTRTSRNVKPAEAAVDQKKQRDLALVAREYLRHLKEPCPWQLDIVSVYYGQKSTQPEFELFQNVLAVA
jgi:putative endonuclease